MMGTEDLAQQTLRTLEERLLSLEVLIYGEAKPDTAKHERLSPGTSIAERMVSIAAKRRQLESRSQDVQELLGLYEKAHARQQQQTGPTFPPGQEAMAVMLVLSYLSQLKTLAVQGPLLSDIGIKDSVTLARMLAQTPRILEAADKMRVQEQQINELRLRSAELVHRWHGLGNVAVGDAISEWENRLMAVERQVRQRAARELRDDIS